MAKLVGWYVDQRVLYACWPGVLTIEDIKRNNAEIIDYLERGTAPVHLIADARFIDSLPTTSVFQLRQLVTFTTHPRLGWIIVLSNNKIITFLASVLPQFGAKDRYRVVSNLEDGISALKHDLTLDLSEARSEMIMEKVRMF